MGGDPERGWRRVLHDGVLAAAGGGVLAEGGPAAASGSDAAAGPASPTPAAAPAGPPPEGEDLELVLLVSPAAHDGRFANVSWLQETPDPVTKLTWDNALLVAPATARRHGLADGDVLSAQVGERVLEAPVLVVPGVAEGTLGLALGYGRSAAGRVGDGVGVSAYAVRTAAAPWIVGGVRVAPTGRRAALARTQDHATMEGRDILREVTVGAAAQPAEEGAHGAEGTDTPLWQRPGFDGPHQWGMVIDLAACTGCNACVVACQAENNVPVVGREQVAKGREMQWLRVDRYYAGDPDEPDLAFQPVPCQQCENAPCEEVCPVAATVHDPEGLNAMVYNRCIGTRYCSNNCPYKVRRFNFFNYTKATPELLQLAMNPDVTVRSRGVMEKCTYCVQRINEGKDAARRAGRPLADGAIRTACQQTCPGGAITFGDLTDADSAVSRAKRSPRNYVLLAELGNRPRTSYLARLRNPNPAWEAGA